jgi:type I restriction enzyme R subunit
VITNINREDRLVQQTFADHLHDRLGWDSVYAFNTETFGPDGTLGRESVRDVVLERDLRAALERLNDDVSASAIDQAIEKLTALDLSRTTLQHNQERDGFIRDGVPVEWRDERDEQQRRRLKVIDFAEWKRNDEKERGQVDAKLLPLWTQTAATRAEIETAILDELWSSLPRTAFSDEDCESLAEDVYSFVWQCGAGAQSFSAARRTD